VVVWPLLVDERGGHMETFVLVKDGYTATTIGQTMEPPQLDVWLYNLLYLSWR
jgi:hypothetical protein